MLLRIRCEVMFIGVALLLCAQEAGPESAKTIREERPHTEDCGIGGDWAVSVVLDGDDAMAITAAFDRPQTGLRCVLILASELLFVEATWFGILCFLLAPIGK